MFYLLIFAAALAFGGERQLTNSPRNHALDNNDNFSSDDRFLCFDTRGSGQAIMKVDVATGEESVIYAAGPTVVAASYVPGRDEVVFIHGSFNEPYAKTNRRGAVVDGAGKLTFLDLRDISGGQTAPGAHRGGTHRHEYSLNGSRVAFTYDDHLLPEFGRTIGMLSPHANAPRGATHWFNVLVPVVPEANAKPGDIVMAASDSWVGSNGTMRAFIGKVKEDDGSYRSSLFLIEIPTDVDVTTGFSGDGKRYPTPPKGVKIRRLTEGNVTGIVRGTQDGKWIAYLATGNDGMKQVFVINSGGGKGRQVTRVPLGVLGSVRWHPSGKFFAAATKQNVIVTNVETGKTVNVTDKPGDALVWSNNGKTLAFNRRVGEHQQIFVVPFNADEF